MIDGTHMRCRHRTAVARALGAILFASVALLLPSCENGGHFTVLGYTTRPNYNANVHTVRVNIFKNFTMYRGLEFELAQALTREIEQKTPFKVVGVGQAADTELTGTIVTFNKNVINRDQLNEVREAETVLTAVVVWKDLRTGEVLSNPTSGAQPPMPLVMPDLTNMLPLPQTSLGTEDPLGTLLPTVPPPGPAVVAPTTPSPGTPGAPPAPPAQGVVIQSTASFIPELGGSITTARQRNVNSLAVQIISMMELPWPTPNRTPCTPGDSVIAP